MTWQPDSQMAQGLFGNAMSQYMNQNLTPEQWRGLLPGQGGAQPNLQSQWNQLNGRLLGDTYLPPDVSTVDKGKGWYDVMFNDSRVGYLRPGGDNGRFINDTGWAMPQPQLPSLPPTPQQPQAGGMTPQPQPFVSNGAYGNQAAQLAGLLGQPMQPTGNQGLLGGGKQTGFRIPGK